MERELETLGARLFVVDDEEPNVRLLERMLRASGFDDVLSTTDPREVESIVTDARPDLILLDLLMPHLDGFEVMRRIREVQGPEEFLPILVLTADVTEETKRRALAAGADDFVTKPFDPLEVTLRIKNLLRTRRLHLGVEEHNRTLESSVAERTKELEETLDALRTADSARRRLLSRLVAAQEEERRRIAHDIHDDSIQVMTAAGMRLAVLRAQLGAVEDADGLDRLERTVEEAIARLRQLLFELRPPALDRDGLAAAISEQLQRAAQSAGWRVEVKNGAMVEPPDAARMVLYRIAQEAITNARKHASASRVRVQVEAAGDGYRLEVADDGRGFDLGSEAPEGHVGIIGMAERAELAGGTCTVTSTRGQGTTVEAWIPASAGIEQAGEQG